LTNASPLSSATTRPRSIVDCDVELGSCPRDWAVSETVLNIKLAATKRFMRFETTLK
jgi:hypothetical protein